MRSAIWLQPLQLHVDARADDRGVAPDHAVAEEVGDGMGNVCARAFPGGRPAHDGVYALWCEQAPAPREPTGGGSGGTSYVALRFRSRFRRSAPTARRRSANRPSRDSPRLPPRSTRRAGSPPSQRSRTHPLLRAREPPASRSPLPPLRRRAPPLSGRGSA